MAKVRISRTAGGYVDRWRSYEVIVNEEVRAKLLPGEATTIEVDAGQVDVFIGIDWCRSRAVRMDLPPGSEAQLLCRPRSLLTAFYGITFGRKNYVRLEPA